MAKSRETSRAGMVLRAVIHIAAIAAMVLILIWAARTAYHIGYSVFTSGAMAEAPGDDVVVTITEDMTDGQIGKLLESKGLIQDSLIYRIQAKVYEYDPLPGTYLLNTSETLEEMMDIMTTVPVEEEETEDSGA